MVSFDKLPNGQPHLGSESAFVSVLPSPSGKISPLLKWRVSPSKLVIFHIPEIGTGSSSTPMIFLRRLGVDPLAVLFFHFPAVPSSRPIIHLFAGNAAHIFARIFSRIGSKARFSAM